MVNGDELEYLLRLIFSHQHHLLDQDISLVPIAVQYPNVQDPDLMNLFDIELVRTHIAHNVVALHECL